MKIITDTNISTSGLAGTPAQTEAQLKRPQAWRKHFKTNAFDCFHNWSTLHASGWFTSALIVKYMLTVDYLLALFLWMKNNQQSLENKQTLNTSGLIHETQEQIHFCVKHFSLLKTVFFLSYEDIYISSASLQLYYPAFTFVSLLKCLLYTFINILLFYTCPSPSI